MKRLRKGLRDIQSFSVERGESPDGAAELQHAAPAPHFGEGPAVTIQRVKPASSLETECRWEGVLHPGASGEGRRAELRSEFRGGVGQPAQILADEVQRLLQLENEAGVDGVLTGRAPVDESRGFLVVLRDERSDLLDGRNRQISANPGPPPEQTDIPPSPAPLF